jgi:hypothetical protein
MTNKLTVRLERDGSLYQAYCQELDLLATGRTTTAAIRALLDVLWDYWLYLDSLSPSERAIPPLAEHYQLCRERLLPTMASYGKERLDRAHRADPNLYKQVFQLPA